MANEQLTPEELVKKSGNNFHYQVVKFLREKGWAVSVSPYYNDNLTDKPREIDIVAEKEFNAHTLGGFQWLGTVNVKLFIECKYINKDIVFWFDSVNKEGIINRLTTDTPLESPQLNSGIEKHRYWNIERVAKLFASQQDKTQENEIIYKALNQSLNAMVYYRHGHQSIIPKQSHKAVKVLHTINYPIIVCNDFSQLYKVDVDSEAPPINVKDNFQLEINYAYYNQDKRSITEYFLVDVVSFLSLEQLLKDIEDKDIDTIKTSLAWKHQTSHR